MMAIQTGARAGGGSATTFDRASLQFTINLIRRRNPSLALCLQNIIAPPAARWESYCPTPTDTFRLDLDQATLKQVVESLAEAANEIAREVLATRCGNEDFLIATRDIMDKWCDYARHHQSRSPAAEAEAEAI